jgi:uncharacterized membrane protein
MRIAQALTLLAAVVGTGLMAGLFFSFANAVMPALTRSSDRTYVEAMQRVNESILNPLFLGLFTGSLVLTGLATALHVGSDGGVLPWLIAGLVLYGLVVAITAAVNVPLNDQLAAAGTPTDAAGWAAVRRDFATRWVPWNVVRAVVNVAAFGVLAWALVAHGRATADEEAAGRTVPAATAPAPASAPASAPPS